MNKTPEDLDKKQVLSFLVIDDDSVDQAFFYRLLKAAFQEGCQIDSATTGKVGMRKLMEGTYSCVFLDEFLPDFDGLQILEDLQNSEKVFPPIIMITGIDSKILAAKAKSLGAQEYLTKGDLDAATLKKTVVSAMEKHRIQEIKEKKEENSTHVEALKKDFLLSMSHEFRTPLHAVIGFSECLSSELYGSINPNQKEALGKIVQSAQHLLSLVNNLLMLATMDSGKVDLHIEYFDAIEAVNFCVSVLKGKINPAKVKLVIRYAGTKFMMYADKDRFYQTMISCLSNALKFTEEGEVILYVGKKEEDLVINLKDSGPGMSEEELESVFQPFSTRAGLRDNGELGNLGIGLTIAKKIVEVHRGSLTVTSELGQGTEVEIIWPLDIEE